MNFIPNFSFQIDQSYMKTSIIIQRSMHLAAKPRKDYIFFKKKIHFPSLKEQNVPIITQIDENINKNSQLNFPYISISLKLIRETMFCLSTFYLG